MTVFLGVDLGTSYFKVGVFDGSGRLRGLGRSATPVTRGPAGVHEMPLPAFWQALQLALAEAMRQADVSPRAIGGVSYSSQANTLVLVDRAGEPLTPFVLWTDRRASPLEPELEAFGTTPEFLRTTGFSGLAPEFSGAKWRWFQREQPAVWARMERVLTLSDYFTWALTGESAGDATTAAFTGAFATARGEWWDEALACYGVTAGQLAHPLPPGSACGRTITRAEDCLGIPAGVPFAVGALDHYAGAIGAGLERFSDVSLSIGTVLAALRVGAYDPKAGCFAGRHVDGTRFFRLAFNTPGATEVEQYRATFAPDMGYEQLLQWAAQHAAGARSPDPADPAAVHGAPVLKIVERLAWSHARLLADLGAMPASGPVLVTGGGTRSLDWMQILADMLDVEVLTPSTPEPACLGAAVFAAVAAGEYSNVAEASSQLVRPGPAVRPRPAVAAGYAAERAKIR
jgi:xylulokinase